ncbi:MAG TPA: hypothetical protein ENG59_06520 [Chloroflexi bacterium]|nr:MAG: hypothetical protein DRI46_10150 [Chloroflexota bacterium]HDD55878.1 hypothetical protein [Chloroflexota bacterium]
MNIKVKAPISTAVAIGVGVIVLAGYFIPSMDSIRFILLRTGLVLAAVALLVGIINLATVHIKKIGKESENSGYSLILLISLLITLIVGITDMAQTYLVGRPNFQITNWVFTNIQLPIETSLLAVTTISLTYAAAGILRKRMNMFSISFFFVVLLVLLGSFSIPSATIPFLQVIRDWILRVPALGGARGLLLGIALGTITTGIRVLLGTDRPYGG